MLRPNSVAPERVARMLAEYSAASGHDVAVAHLAERPGPVTRLHGVAAHPLQHRNPLWIERTSQYPVLLRRINKLAAIFNVFTAADFDRVIADFRPDVVHSHSMVELPPTMWAKVSARNIPIVHTLHDYDLVCIKASLFAGGQNCAQFHWACRVVRHYKQWFFKNIDAVVGVSHHILKTHDDAGVLAHLDGGHKHVIWNPVREMRPPARRASARSDQAPMVFGFMGRLVAEKGLATLLEACKLLPQGCWSLRVAGRASAASDGLKAEAEGLPVQFEGQVDAVEFLAGIDCLVVPSLWNEPFGLNAIEALSMNVPVIAADSGGLSEIVRNFDASLLFERGDAAELGLRMNAMLEGQIDLAAAFSRWAAIADRFDIQAVGEAYHRVYEQVERSPR